MHRSVALSVVAQPVAHSRGPGICEVSFRSTRGTPTVGNRRDASSYPRNAIRGDPKAEYVGGAPHRRLLGELPRRWNIGFCLGGRAPYMHPSTAIELVTAIKWAYRRSAAGRIFAPSKSTSPVTPFHSHYRKQQAQRLLLPLPAPGTLACGRHVDVALPYDHWRSGC